MRSLLRWVLVTCDLLLAGCGGKQAPAAPATAAPATAATAWPSSDEPAAPPGRDGVHGMIAFGNGPVFLSHIPAFAPPHDRQLLLQATLDPPRPLDRFFTIEPQRFQLDALREGTLTSFAGTLHDGGFEQGGAAVGPVRVGVERVLLDRALIPDPPAAERLRYLVLGTGAERFFVHRIGPSPSFDQILEVKTNLPTSPSPFEVRIMGRDDSATARLRAGQRVPVVAVTQDAPGTTALVVREVACLVGPAFDRACGS